MRKSQQGMQPKYTVKTEIARPQRLLGRRPSENLGTLDLNRSMSALGLIEPIEKSHASLAQFRNETKYAFL